MSRETVADEAYQRLRAAIVEQRLEPATPLAENDVARALGMSRTPVREALLRLELEGFAVRDATGRLAVLRLTPDQVRNLFALRITLESYAVRLAADRISVAELELLDDLVIQDDRALAGGDIEALGLINQRLHDVLLEASRNRVLVDLVENLRRRTVGLTAFAVGDQADRRQFVHDHAALVQLVRVGDGSRGADLVRNHLERARDLLLAALDEHSDDPAAEDLARRLRPAAPVLDEARPRAPSHVSRMPPTGAESS